MDTPCAVIIQLSGDQVEFAVSGKNFWAFSHSKDPSQTMKTVVLSIDRPLTGSGCSLNGNGTDVEFILDQGEFAGRSKVDFLAMLLIVRL